MTFAAVAPELHRARLNVLPVDAMTKSPLIAWTRWQRERQSPRDVDRLRHLHPDAAVAVVLGGPNLSLVDVDLDDGGRGEADLRALALPVPPTACFGSPGDPARPGPKAPGHHLLFEARPAPPTRRLAPHVEFRSAGHYVLVPPSLGRVWCLGLDHLAGLPDEWRTAASASPLSRGSQTPLLPDPPVASRAVVPVSVLLALGPTSDRGRSPLLAVEAMPDFLPAVVRVLGLPHGEIGRPFRCVLPGHEEHRPSANLWRRADGTVHYADRHRPGREWLTLPEVYFARITGKVRSLRGPELATWKLRLIVAARLAEPAAVEAPALATNVPSHVHRVYAGFLHLLSCRSLYTPGAPAPFTWKFAAAWCGVTERQAGEAIRELLRLGVIRVVGTHKRVTLFLPAGGA